MMLEEPKEGRLSSPLLFDQVATIPRNDSRDITQQERLILADDQPTVFQAFTGVLSASCVRWCFSSSLALEAVSAALSASQRE